MDLKSSDSVIRLSGHGTKQWPQGFDLACAWPLIYCRYKELVIVYSLLSSCTTLIIRSTQRSAQSFPAQRNLLMQATFRLLPPILMLSLNLRTQDARCALTKGLFPHLLYDSRTFSDPTIRRTGQGHSITLSIISMLREIVFGTSLPIFKYLVCHAQMIA